LIYPDLSKWNINITEYSDISSSSYNFIQTNETNSLLSEEINVSNLSDKLSNMKDYNDIKLNEYNNINDNSKNELDDYYDNFYN